MKPIKQPIIVDNKIVNMTNVEYGCNPLKFKYKEYRSIVITKENRIDIPKLVGKTGLLDLC
jgi:hypothetical protein